MILLNNKNSNIRRIDELGRIVIPKDMRKKLHLKENEPLEIYIENDEIIIKKYSALPDIKEFINTLIDIGNRITGNKYIVTNRTEIIAATNREYISQGISSNLESYCLTGKDIKNERQNLIITQSTAINANIILVPLLIEGDRSGLIIEYNEERNIQNESAIKIFKYLIESNLSNTI